MTTSNQINSELQVRIDALPDENLRANILRFLSRPWKRTKSNEQIFDEMLADYEKVSAERAKWRQWHDDEVLAFIEYFKEELPDDYVEYLRQERENKEIDSNLSWKIEQLSEKWISDLASIDYILLLSRVRSKIQTIVAMESEIP